MAFNPVKTLVRMCPFSERRGHFSAAFTPSCREDGPTRACGPSGASKFVSAHAVAVDEGGVGMRKNTCKSLEFKSKFKRLY